MRIHQLITPRIRTFNQGSRDIFTQFTQPGTVAFQWFPAFMSGSFTQLFHLFPNFSTIRRKQKRPRKPYASGVFRSVEVAGFEPAAFWSRTGQRLFEKSDRVGVCSFGVTSVTQKKMRFFFYNMPAVTLN